MKAKVPAAWLNQVRKAVENREDLLVVCRTAAAEREVYRQLERWTHDGFPAGWAGLQVTTLTGLARAAAPRPLVPAARDEKLDLRAGHPWQPKLADRPGLRRHLRRHVERAHCLKAAGSDLRGLRPELQALLTDGWSCPDTLDGCRCLLAGEEPQPRPEGRVLPRQPSRSSKRCSPLV
ncbi:MAG: hypothetical protein HY905_01720 [Deltaproteobacteria bacterium]|nr:hypothetical protein [Deltaproteobacteria bacterium]